MLRAAIVEKAKDKQEYIAKAVKALNMDIQVEVFGNKYDFLEHLDAEATSFDILLLNTTVQQEGDGIEIASFVRSKNSRVMITFVTESTRYYAEAFSVFATGYLMYPFEMGELHNCITFYYEKTKRERRSTIMIKERGGSYRRLFTRFITYMESNNREVTIHMEDGSEIVTYAKLGEAEENLPKKQFVRCHQSYVLNLYFVEEFGKGRFLVNGADIPVSRKFQQSAKDTYYEYVQQHS